MKLKKWQKRVLLVLAVLAVIVILFYLLQRFWAHRDGYFVPDYPQEVLTENSDYETIFLQTGLGAAAVDRLLEEGKFQEILKAQTAFFHPPEADCSPMLGWFTREDRLINAPGTPLVDLQPGDILVSLSTHTGGWRHGHAGLVINENTILESAVLGEDSGMVSAAHWTTYSNYAVLRVKGVTPQLQREVAEYGRTTLNGVPYRISSGFIGPKAPEPDDWQFGLQCSYLVWYAWQHFDYDLDSDGGRLVSTCDLLHSDELEVVQLYGMDPREFWD
ncbi:MAG: hypothetical protein J1F02_06865 [Lachnospiraceae bacterium]|nr:hypothetical protein [Lachnospiraceae bacterium]